MAMDDIYQGMTVERRAKRPVLRTPLSAEATALGTLGKKVQYAGRVVDDELQGYLKQRERSKTIQAYGDMTTKSRQMMAEMLQRRGRQTDGLVGEVSEALENDYRELSGGMSKFAGEMFESMYASHRKNILTTAAAHEARQGAEAAEVSKQQALTNHLETIATSPMIEGQFDDLLQKGIRILTLQYPDLELEHLEDIVANPSEFPILSEEINHYRGALAAAHVDGALLSNHPDRIAAAKALLGDYTKKKFLDTTQRQALTVKINEYHKTDQAWQGMQYAMKGSGGIRRTKAQRQEAAWEYINAKKLPAETAQLLLGMVDTENRRMDAIEADNTKHAKGALYGVMDTIVPDDGELTVGLSPDTTFRLVYDLIDQSPLSAADKEAARSQVRERMKRKGVIHSEEEMKAIEEIMELQEVNQFAGIDFNERFGGRLRQKHLIKYKEQWIKARERKSATFFVRSVNELARSKWNKPSKEHRRKRVEFFDAAWSMYDLRRAKTGRDLEDGEVRDLVHDMQIEGYLERGGFRPDSPAALWQLHGPYSDKGFRKRWYPAGQDMGTQEGLFYKIPTDDRDRMTAEILAENPGMRASDITRFDLVSRYEIWKMSKGGTLDQ